MRDAINELIKDSGIDTIDSAKIQEVVSATVNDFYAYMQEKGIVIDAETDINASFAEYMNERGNDFIREQLSNIVSELPEIGNEEIQKLSSKLVAAYQSYASANNKPQPEKIRESFGNYLSSTEGQTAIASAVSGIVDVQDLQDQISKAFGDSMSSYSDSLNDVMQKLMNEIGKRIAATMQDAVSQFAQDMPNAIRFNPDALQNAFSLNMDEKDIEEMMMSMMSAQSNSYEGNLRLLGYSDLEKPSMISIYPNDFDAKTVIIEQLDAYNARMEEEDADKVIRYTDTVGVLMSSVTDIVDTISYVLIAFVAISLIVSSIMIGVITYISVLERNKEIGILRAIGASKRNISQVFNAETFIIGLLAGLFGIGISRLLLIPGNMLIHALSDNNNINAVLPWNAAVILIMLSIILTLIGGIIPSRKAAKSDPVTALRTE
ncbi:MAG: ABC transporter permease [Erysipelotrichaceae bacterium]|nr:ABC transporter permease [Erysipelotrichaceae bacterium]